MSETPMLDYDVYKQHALQASPIGDASRAIDTWRHIQHKPTEIVIARDVYDVDTQQMIADDLDAQIVRVEFDSTSSGSPQVEGPAGASSQMVAKVFGVKGHPDPAIPDTDIERGDRFIIGDQTFTVMHVTVNPGEKQATCQVLE